MKKVLGIILFCGLASYAVAEEKVTFTRAFVQFGVLATVAGDGDWSRSGWGVSVRPFWFLDPSKPEGFYAGFFSGTFSHSAGGVSLADTRLVSLGWRGNPLRLWGLPPLEFQTDFSLAPTLGQRISGNTILGSSYAGVGATLGIYVPIGDWGDLGLSWEPTINLSTFGGPDIAQKSYFDFAVYWTAKSYTKTTHLPWK